MVAGPPAAVSLAITDQLISQMKTICSMLQTSSLAGRCQPNYFANIVSRAVFLRLKRGTNHLATDQCPQTLRELMALPEIPSRSLGTGREQRERKDGKERKNKREGEGEEGEGTEWKERQRNGRFRKPFPSSKVKYATKCLDI
jgi:hypothetical protein